MAVIIEGMTPVDFISTLNDLFKSQGTIINGAEQGDNLLDSLNNNFNLFKDYSLTQLVFNNISVGMNGLAYITNLNNNCELLSNKLSMTTFINSNIGDDVSGDGSINNPYATLFKACSVTSVSGSIIYVFAGIYEEGDVQCMLSEGVCILGEGDASHIIILETQEYGMIRCSSNPLPSGIPINGNNIISKIKIDGNYVGAFGVGIYNRSNVVLRHCTITRTAICGIKTYIGSVGSFMSGLNIQHCTFIDCGYSIHHDNVIDTDISYNIFDERFRKGVDSRIIWSEKNSNRKFHHNTCYKLADNGVAWNFIFEDWDCNGGMEIYENKFYGGGQMLDIAGVANVKGIYEYSTWIHHNRFEVTEISHDYGLNNYAICFEGTNEYAIVNNNIFIDFDRPISINVGQTPRYVKDIRIYYNIFQNSGGFFGEGGRNIQIINTQVGVTIEDIFIYNNVLSASNLLASNIYIQSPAEIKNIYIRNNIIENTNSNAFSYGWLMTACTDLYDVYVQNNILHNNYNNNQIVGNITNLFYNNNLIANPLFVTPGSDFHLQEGSPAINAGVEVGLTEDYEGSSIVRLPAIGAYEK